MEILQDDAEVALGTTVEYGYLHRKILSPPLIPRRTHPILR